MTNKKKREKIKVGISKKTQKTYQEKEKTSKKRIK
jgi:hypothetical protein